MVFSFSKNRYDTTMNIVEKLEKTIKEALESLEINHSESLHLEHPRELSHGDFSTNIAMVLGKKLGQKPQELAHTLSEKITEQNNGDIAHVSIAGPGFINITLDQDVFTRELARISREQNTYGHSLTWEGKKILVEHSSPNLFKPFHIGHMMNNTVGEAITRLCRTSGAEVTMISYPSDVSLGIGKAVWQLLQYGVEKLDEYKTLSEKMQFLGRCYSEGTQAYNDDENIEPRVREITQEIYEHKDTAAYQAYKKGRDLNLQYFIESTARLGSAFDGFIFESEAGVIGKEMIKEYTPTVYTESEGAIIYEGEQDGLHTRVFINKEGNPTYEAKDTGLLKLKFDRYQPDQSIFVTDNQQGPYFEVVVTAAGKINKEWQEKTIHKTHGRMQFKGAKMSSRLGNTPIVSDILGAVNDEVKERAEGRTLSQEEADMISIAAIKYTILRTQAGKNINFDPDTSLSFEGDSGPYLQYTYARIQSILEKAGKEGINIDAELPKEWETTDIERYLYRFPEIIQTSFAELHPHHVVTYITELAQMFNSWYGNTKIVDASDESSGYKLAIAEAVGQVLRNGLWVLGIDSPDTM